MYEIDVYLCLLFCVDSVAVHFKFCLDSLKFWNNKQHSNNKP